MGEVISLEAVRNGTYRPAPPPEVAKTEAAQPHAAPAVIEDLGADAVLIGSGKSEFFDYSTMVSEAMMSVVYRVLKFAAKNGLPANSSILFSFDTQAPGVEMSGWLKKKYPEEITLLLDAWWEDLIVTDQGFSVTMNFSDVKERFFVPFYALTGFRDGGFEFRLAHMSSQTPEPPTAA